jgi:hypothetical protein
VNDRQGPHCRGVSVSVWRGGGEGGWLVQWKKYLLWRGCG